MRTLCLPPAALVVESPDGSSNHHLQSFVVKDSASAIPDRDAASQDPRNTVEVGKYPGVHTKPILPFEEEELLSSCCFLNSLDPC